MMKRGFFPICSIILIGILCVIFLLPCGCGYNQPGETTAEGHRRHRRVIRTNQQEMMADIDRVLLLDEPSNLTDKRIP